MKLHGWLLITIVFTLPTLVRADDDAKKAALKLKGSWVIEKMTLEGEDNVEVKDLVLTIDGEKWTARNGEITGTLKAGTDKKLLTIDMSIGKGDNAGMTLLGIYEIKDDILKLCLCLPGESTRPTELTADAGSKRVMLELRKK